MKHLERGVSKIRSFIRNSELFGLYTDFKDDFEKTSSRRRDYIEWVKKEEEDRRLADYNNGQYLFDIQLLENPTTTSHSFYSDGEDDYWGDHGQMDREREVNKKIVLLYNLLEVDTPNVYLLEKHQVKVGVGLTFCRGGIEALCRLSSVDQITTEKLGKIITVKNRPDLKQIKGDLFKFLQGIGLIKENDGEYQASDMGKDLIERLIEGSRLV